MGRQVLLPLGKLIKVTDFPKGRQACFLPLLSSLLHSPPLPFPPLPTLLPSPLPFPPVLSFPFGVPHVIALCPFFPFVSSPTSRPYHGLRGFKAFSSNEALLHCLLKHLVHTPHPLASPSRPGIHHSPPQWERVGVWGCVPTCHFLLWTPVSRDLR